MRTEQAPPAPAPFEPAREESEPVRAHAPSSEPDSYQTFAHEPPFKARRNPAKLLTIAALIIFLLLSAAAVAVSYFGLPTIGVAGFGQSGTSLVLELTRKPEKRTMESGNELLAVSGRIVNKTDKVQRVPQIRAELRDTQGRVVYGWSIAAPVDQLQPGASVTFNSAQVDVPRGAKALKLEFAPTF